MNLATEDYRLITSLKNGDKDAFETIYNKMALPLLQYVNSRIHQKESSEGIVQEIFVSLWTRRQELTIQSSLQSYLYGAAKFQVLTYIRSEKVRHEYADHFVLYFSQISDMSTEELLYLADLKIIIEGFIQQLPQKCQTAFRLSRFEHKSIIEIAEEMNISPRTVENYITQALKHLRHKLSRHPT